MGHPPRALWRNGPPMSDELDPREKRRADLLEASEAVGELILAALQGRIAEAQARGNIPELERLKRLAMQSTASFNRHAARELELLGPPPLILELGEPVRAIGGPE
jgi:hypothetical protein